MSRRCKRPIAALVAVFALFALSASAAQAGTLMSEGNVSAALTGDPETTNVLSVEGNKSECSTDHIATAGEVASPAESAEVHPEWSGCRSFGFLSSTVNSEGCNLIFGFGATVGGNPNTVNGTLTVSCDSGHVITITSSTCQLTIGSQGPVGGVMYTNTAGKIMVELNVTLAATKTKDGIGCPFSGTGSTTAIWTGNLLVSATHSGSAVSITVE